MSYTAGSHQGELHFLGAVKSSICILQSMAPLQTAQTDERVVEEIFMQS